MSENNYENFKSSLVSLKESPGWKLIEKVLDANIKDAENDMFDPKKKMADPIEEIERTNVLRIERNERVRLKNQPDELIKIYSSNHARLKEDFEFDPYEK